MKLVPTTGSLLQRAADRVFGYDFFISYSHNDGLNYPKSLKSQLEVAGYKVCLDQDIYVAGDDLRNVTRRRVRMSRKLVVIARPGAMQSDWVEREVEIFKAKGRTPIVINVNQSIEQFRSKSVLADQVWEAEWLRLEENLCQLDADVSDQVIHELIRSFDATRQETKRLRILEGIAIGFAALALAAGAGWYIASTERDRAEQNEQRAISGQVDLHVQSGMDAVDDGYLWAAAVWFAEALQLDHTRGGSETDHRTRLAAVRKQLPQLRWIWFVD
ncbi:MAG: toll/interleukin-1 receptor domain-containing protein, partial [Desulfobacterales bacterium]